MKREHLGILEFGPETLALEDVHFYDLRADEAGVFTYRATANGEAWIEFNFVDRLKEIVPPLD